MGIFKLFVNFILVSFLHKLEVSLTWTKSNPVFGTGILVIFSQYLLPKIFLFETRFSTCESSRYWIQIQFEKINIYIFCFCVLGKSKSTLGVISVDDGQFSFINSLVKQEHKDE